MAHIHIGQCIYCGVTDTKLTNEHIIPFALGGTVMLLKASCETCRDITSKCELNPLSKTWIEARAYLDIPSRKRNFSEELFPIKVILQDGTETTISLKREELVGFTPFLELDTPGLFKRENQYIHGYKIVASSMFIFNKENLEALKSKYNVKTFTIESKYNGLEFPRMIARIAYCTAAYALGLECFDERLVLPAIMGKDENIGYWVGGDLDGEIVPLIGKHNQPNVVKLIISTPPGQSKQYVFVRLKFFAHTDTPEYVVVVGTLKKDFRLSQNDVTLQP